MNSASSWWCISRKLFEVFKDFMCNVQAQATQEFLVWSNPSVNLEQTTYLKFWYVFMWNIHKVLQ
jgi:hypothetical protein